MDSVTADAVVIDGLTSNPRVVVRRSDPDIFTPSLTELINYLEGKIEVYRIGGIGRYLYLVDK